MRFNAVSTAVICLGQAFVSNQTIPFSFVQRIRATIGTLQSVAFPTAEESAFAPFWNEVDDKLARYSSLLVSGGGAEFFDYANAEDTYSPPLYLILSGSDMKQNGISEARYMYSQIKSQLNITNLALFNNLERNGIRVILEEQSRSTLENILNCLEFIEKHDIQRIYLVTSDYHMFRSILLAKLIWNQKNSFRTVIPVFSASEESPPLQQTHNFQIIPGSHNATREISVPLTFLSSKIAHHSRPNISAGVTGSCSSSCLSKVYRPLECRPADISEWYLLERLDLEKKAVLSLSDNFRKYPELKTIAIPLSEIQNTLQDINNFNTTIINSYLHAADRIQ
jgi:hypothetical protein